MVAAADASSQQYRFGDLTLDAGRRQVRRGSDTLALSKLTYGLLRVLVEAAPNLVTHDELVAKVWGTRRVITPENLAQRVMILRHTLGESAGQPRYIEAVRGQGYRLIPEVHALPGRLSARVEPPNALEGGLASLRRQPRTAIAAVTLTVLLVAALAYAIVDFLQEAPPTDSDLPALPLRPDAVAVLPFVNMSESPADEYFSDGVASEILNSLARDARLKVVARTSSFAFKGQRIDIREIAQRLGAQRIVEGSVRRHETRLRITVQLIDALSGTHLWSDSYERRVDEIFDIQDEIAEQIVAAIRNELGAPPAAPLRANPMTANIEAYDRYLLGNRYYWQRGRGPVEKAIELYKQAVDLDPQFAEAWAALAAAYNSAPSHGVRPAEGHPHDLAERAAERAVELDDRLGLAWMVLGNVKPRPRYRNFEASAYYLMKAIEVSPYEPTVVHWMSEGMLGVGRLQEALRYAQLGYEMDPMAALRNLMLGCTSAANGQYERALRYIDQTRELGHWSRLVWTCGLIARLEAGDFDAAQVWFEVKPFEASAEEATAERLYLAARRNPSPTNRQRAAEMIMAAYTKEGGPRIDGDHAQYLLASQGAVDTAFELSRMRMRVASYIDTTWWWLPSMRAFRTDPRFVELAEQLRMPGFWRQYGWPDECRPQGASFVCD